jgi:hypothetical protein
VCLLGALWLGFVGAGDGSMTVHPLSEPVPKTTNFRQGESERPTMETLRFGRRMTAREVEGDAGSSSEDEGGEGEEPKATGTKFGTWDGVGDGRQGLNLVSVEGTVYSWELGVLLGAWCLCSWELRACASWELCVCASWELCVCVSYELRGSALSELRRWVLG